MSNSASGPGKSSRSLPPRPPPAPAASRQPQAATSPPLPPPAARHAVAPGVASLQFQQAVEPPRVQHAVPQVKRAPPPLPQLPMQRALVAQPGVVLKRATPTEEQSALARAEQAVRDGHLGRAGEVMNEFAATYEHTYLTATTLANVQAQVGSDLEAALASYKVAAVKAKSRAHTAVAYAHQAAMLVLLGHDATARAMVDNTDFADRPPLGHLIFQFLNQYNNDSNDCESLAQIARHAPDDWLFQALYGVCILRLSPELDEASDALAAAKRLAPAAQLPKSLLAYCHLQQGDLEKAQKELALVVAPNVYTRIVRALLAYRKARPGTTEAANALFFAKDACNLAPTCVTAVHTYALAAAEFGNESEGLQARARVEKVFGPRCAPDELRNPFMLHARAFLSVSEALAMRRQADQPGSQLSMTQAAVMRDAANKLLDDALASLKNILAGSGEAKRNIPWVSTSIAYLLLERAHEDETTRQQKYRDAVVSATKGIADRNIFSLGILGLAHLRAKQPSDAVQYLSEAMTLMGFHESMDFGNLTAADLSHLQDNFQPHIHQYMGEALHAQAALAKISATRATALRDAVFHLEIARRSAPNNQITLLLAEAYSKLGRQVECLELLENFLPESVTEKDAYTSLMMHCAVGKAITQYADDLGNIRSLPRVEDQLAMLSARIDRRDATTDYYNLRAVLYVNQGDYAAAAADWQAAANRTPDARKKTAYQTDADNMRRRAQFYTRWYDTVAAWSRTRPKPKTMLGLQPSAANAFQNGAHNGVAHAST